MIFCLFIIIAFKLDRISKENTIIINKKDNSTNNILNKKIGLAFVYNTLYANGIARFITVTANNLIKTGKYDICFITSNPYGSEYIYNSSIKRFFLVNNYASIRNLTKYENIDIFILQNVYSPSEVSIYHSMGKKVISVFHGSFMSPMVFNSVRLYRGWSDFDLFDAFVFIVSDDYYFYKKLGFKNGIYIPNLLTFEPKETINSNLTYNNIVMLGRHNDLIKGVVYAIKAMNLIIKEVPDAKLFLVTSDSRIQFLSDLIKELNLTNSVFIRFYTHNITSYFLSSSIHMYTSFSEAYPMAMNEGKAHGLPIIAFDVPYSIPYQDGVIVVDQLDYEALARETIKLLKDYNYRKRMGEYAKKSLDKISNKEIIEIWEKLCRSLISTDRNDYRKLQNEIETKYYNEEKSIIHLRKSYEYMKKINNNIACHSFDSFTDINYLKKIKECNIINNKNT